MAAPACAAAIPSSAILLGSIGRNWDMLGVCMLPVSAQLMITLFTTLSLANAGAAYIQLPVSRMTSKLNRVAPGACEGVRFRRENGMDQEAEPQPAAPAGWSVLRADDPFNRQNGPFF